MIQRFKCWWRGHSWEFYWVRCPGNGHAWLFSGPSAYFERYGITILSMVCLKCGASQERRFVGVTGEAVSDGRELAELRKMAGLK